jgi:hypothetical protein
MPLALGETDIYWTSQYDDYNLDRHAHQEVQRQCYVEIGRRGDVAKRFEVNQHEGVGPFRLTETDHLIVHNGQRLLTLLAERCSLTPEEDHLINQAYAAVTDLRHRRPANTLLATLALRRQSQDVTSELFWSIWLMDDRLLMTAGGTITSHFMSAQLPFVKIILEAGGRHYLKGNLEEWFLRFEEAVGIQSPSLAISGFSVETYIGHLVT